MSPEDEGPEISILDARLADIDRRLRSIQTGLVEEAAAPEAPPEVEWSPPIEVPGEVRRLTPVGNPPPVAADPSGQLHELMVAQEDVLSSMRELLQRLERVATVRPAWSDSAPEVGPVSVSAGPFASTEALRAFEQALQGLPEVSAVQVRGFEGGDRAIVDVHLSAPTA
ncbi:MAG: hypothetical protein M3016_10095 [Actinomycetota bacterium]|nr:hypothetical protein [Actinomycetota bacterium]